jgi:putative flavoprotein involved in K+ transport
MTQEPQPRRHEVIVIGAGQSGLAASFHLAQAGLDHVVLERAQRLGDVWRSRYDSLRLYSPARFDALPGLPFPLDPMGFPSGTQMADYLEGYAQRFDLPVRTGVAVTALRAHAGGGYEVVTTAGVLRASNVIVATGPFQRAHIPAFAAELDERMQQLHSMDYRNPGQIVQGPVLVVGASHSGADIAHELASDFETYLAGRSHGQLPFSVDGRVGRATWPLIRLLATRVFTLATPIGRRMAPNVRMGGGPLLRHRRQDLLGAGVEWIEERVVGAADGKPRLAAGRVLDVAAIVWCTGFSADYSWIEPSITGPDGWPSQQRGVVAAAPGLYVLGTPFQFSFASMLVLGAGEDARYVVEHIQAARETSASMPIAA